MGRIYTVMGKSATGKDTVYRCLLERFHDRFRKVVLYTTRPIRAGEQNGVEYYFVTIPQMEEMKAAGKILEIRMYNTVYGPWYYFTANDGQINLDESDYMMITTLAGYESIRDHFGTENVIPIYTEIDNYTRLHRAVEREGRQKVPNFSEVCRRYLADEEDFSESELQRLGVNKRFINDDLDRCLEEIGEWISK
ncbi:MAG: guanylate kinase [Lachnospiraceae bacterium]|nr:guanylate kinase [Lachnospiraceae bacterium]MBP5250110.1 guanylate kinase [Lachnospiraceae bacterium]